MKSLVGDFAGFYLQQEMAFSGMAKIIEGYSKYIILFLISKVSKTYEAFHAILA